MDLHDLNMPEHLGYCPSEEEEIPQKVSLDTSSNRRNKHAKLATKKY